MGVRTARTGGMVCVRCAGLTGGDPSADGTGQKRWVSFVGRVDGQDGLSLRLARPISNSPVRRQPSAPAASSNFSIWWWM